MSEDFEKLTERAANAEPWALCEECAGCGVVPEATGVFAPSGLQEEWAVTCRACEGTGIRKGECRLCSTALGFADEREDERESHYCNSDCAFVDRVGNNDGPY